jgi:hypothetical protein
MFFQLILPTLILAVLLFLIPRDHDTNATHFLKRIIHALICAPLSIWIGGMFSDMSGWDEDAAFPGIVYLVVGIIFLIRLVWFSGALFIYLLRKSIGQR